MTTFSVSSLALERSCLTASSCVFSLRISPSASPSNSNRATNSASGRPLGFSTCLNATSCSSGVFVASLRLAASSFLPATLRVMLPFWTSEARTISRNSGSSWYWHSRSTSFLTVMSSLRLTTWPGGLPSSFSSTTLA